MQSRSLYLVACFRLYAVVHRNRANDCCHPKQSFHCFILVGLFCTSQQSQNSDPLRVIAIA